MTRRERRVDDLERIRRTLVADVERERATLAAVHGDVDQARAELSALNVALMDVRSKLAGALERVAAEMRERQ